MYNENVKLQFIKDEFSNEGSIKNAKFLFEATEKYEMEWNADICTRSVSELKPVVDSLVGLRTSSKWTRLGILKRYSSWCMANNIDGACDSILRVEVDNLEKIKVSMVSSPLQMYKYLSDVFPDESRTTINDVYRGYLWLAFFGLPLEEALAVETSDVNIAAKTITRKNGKTVDIYPKALGTFEKLLSDKMIYKKEDYAEEHRERERAPGNLLLRGFRQPTWGSKYTINYISNRINAAYKDGKTDKKITYKRAWLSGVFCRAFEKEEAYGVVDFCDVAEDYYENAEFRVEVPIEKRIELFSKNYLIDYNKWKAAFNKWV